MSYNPNLGIAFCNTNSRQAGIEFENQVHHIISNYLSVINIMRERDIINNFGPTCTAIDHMFDEPYSNNTFCIQSKWKNSKESLDYIHHFIKCVETIQKKKLSRVYGIILSKQPITANSKTAFKHENLSNPNISFINIHLNPNELNLDLELSQNQLIDRLLDYLHQSHQIWTYDQDGSVIMRYL